MFKLLFDDEFIKFNISEIKGSTVFYLTVGLWLCHWVLWCVYTNQNPFNIFQDCGQDSKVFICLKGDIAPFGLMIFCDLIACSRSRYSTRTAIDLIAKTKKEAQLMAKYSFCLLNRFSFFTILTLSALAFFYQVPIFKGVFDEIGGYFITTIGIWLMSRGGVCLYLAARTFDELDEMNSQI